MPAKEMYQVWLGDVLVINTDDKDLASASYSSIPCGKGKAPSKRRELIKCKTLKSD